MTTKKATKKKTSKATRKKRPLGGDERAPYVRYTPGDRPDDLAALEQRDARDRIYEAAVMLIICEHVNRCRAVLQRPEETEGESRRQLALLHARFREDLHTALSGAQVAAEVAYPLPAKIAQEVVV